MLKKPLSIASPLKRCLLTGVLFLPFISFAQWKHALFVEGMGGGGLASLNYQLSRDFFPLFHVHFRTGAGALRFIDFDKKFNPDLSFPLGLEMAYGEKHQFFLGAGPVLATIVRFSEQGKQRSWNINMYFTAGYKLELKSRIFLKIAYNPLLEKGYYRHWAAAGIGYYFN